MILRLKTYQKLIIAMQFAIGRLLAADSPLATAW